MNTITEYKLVAAKGDLNRAVIELLQENNLPVSDLGAGKHLFALIQNDTLIGAGGLELFDNCALIRSVSIKSDFRGKGWGKLINKELEKISRQKGIDRLYLLTISAKGFFAKEGYKEIKREDVPTSIKNTSEFSSVCPSSATVMRKILS
jgi:amino-acid N-acetyltransferase